jgi:hypothetical protein
MVDLQEEILAVARKHGIVKIADGIVSVLHTPFHKGAWTFTLPEYTLPPISLTRRELAIVLASIRNAQRSTGMNWNLRDAFCDYFTDTDGQVTQTEFDDLCDKINA